MSAKRCPAIAPNGHDFAGNQCGDYAGHEGPHTALVATEWIDWSGNLGTRKRRTSLGVISSDVITRTPSDQSRSDDNG